MKYQLDNKVISDPAFINQALARKRFWNTAAEIGYEEWKKNVKEGMARITPEKKAKMTETRRKNLALKSPELAKKHNANIAAGVNAMSEEKKKARMEKWRINFAETVAKRKAAK